LAISLVAASALAVAALSASAQQPGATSPAPGTKADATSDTTKKKPIPACQGLKEAECKAKPECLFVPASKRKDGRPIAAYCRAKPKPADKKTDAGTPAAPSAPVAPK
jgi:hypothetical protein